MKKVILGVLLIVGTLYSEPPSYFYSVTAGAMVPKLYYAGVLANKETFSSTSYRGIIGTYEPGIGIIVGSRTNGKYELGLEYMLVAGMTMEKKFYDQVSINATVSGKWRSVRGKLSLGLGVRVVQFEPQTRIEVGLSIEVEDRHDKDKRIQLHTH